MGALSRVLSVGLLTGVVSLACKDSSGPGNGAASTTGKAGDGQSAATGAILPIPLSFVVLNNAGQPLQGASVGWTVPTGTASVNPTTSTTDALGTASTTVTLGGAIGAVTVRGTVSGLAPVDFSITVVDPCTYRAPHTIGTTVNAALTTLDCRLGPGYYYDFYEFTLGNQQSFTASMNASFDTYLEIVTASLGFVGVNDDISQSDLNSRVQLILAPGSYVLAPNSALTNITGPYTMVTAARAQTISGCEVIFVTRGIMVSETVAPTDCPTDFQGGAGYGDAVAIYAAQGTVLEISQHSTAFDAMLKLYRVDSLGAIPPVATNDDSSATTNDAFISYTVPVENVFVVFFGTATAGETGAYSFTISSSTTGATAGNDGNRFETLRLAPAVRSGRWPLPGERQ